MLLPLCCRNTSTTGIEISELRRQLTSLACNSYYIFKEYLHNILSLKCLGFLLNFRCGVLSINIDKGRFENVLRQQRICPVGNTNNIQDEYHFVLVYPSMAFNEQT